MKRKITVFAILGIIIGGCGKKFPLPEENNEGMPSEKSYVRITNTNWDNLRFTEVRDMILGRDGYVYVISEDTVYKFTTTGEYGEPFIVAEGIKTLTQDEEEENIYIGLANGMVLKYDYSGQHIKDTIDLREICQDTTYTDSFLTDIYALGVDHLIVSFSPLHLVVRVHNDTIDTVATYGTGIRYTRYPAGVYGSLKKAVVLYASRGNNWVEGLSLYAPHYNVVHLGGESYEGGNADTLFLSPIDVAIDDSGYVYVLDGGNKAMKKFSYNGEFITVSYFESEPVAMDVSRDGKDLYVAFKDHIEKYKLPEIPVQPGGEQ